MAKVWSTKYDAYVEECWETNTPYRSYTTDELKSATITSTSSGCRIEIPGQQARLISRKQFRWMQSIVKRVIIY